MKELIEKLAAIEHERWSRWHEHAKINWSVENIERWDRQAKATYAELSELEKESDRKEVYKYWPLIESLCRKVREESLNEAADIADRYTINIGEYAQRINEEILSLKSRKKRGEENEQSARSDERSSK